MSPVLRRDVLDDLRKIDERELELELAVAELRNLGHAIDGRDELVEVPREQRDLRLQLVGRHRCAQRLKLLGEQDQGRDGVAQLVTDRGDEVVAGRQRVEQVFGGFADRDVHHGVLTGQYKNRSNRERALGPFRLSSPSVRARRAGRAHPAPESRNKILMMAITRARCSGGSSATAFATSATLRGI